MQSGLLSRLMGRPAEVKNLPVTVRYVPTLLRWELAKSAAGSLGGLAILLGLNPSPWVGVPVAAVSVLFAGYGWQQVRRRRLAFEVTEERASLRQGARVQTIPWAALERVQLKYYAFGRRADHGTLVLALAGAGQRIRLDSGADEFATALFYAAQVARNRALAIDPTTLANFEQLGL